MEPMTDEPMKPRSFNCPDALWARLRREANRRSVEDDRRVSMSELIREGIRLVTGINADE